MKRATQICSYFVKAFGYNHFKASIKASHTLFRELHGLMLLQDPWGVSFLVRNPCGWWPSLPEFRSDLLGSFSPLSLAGCAQLILPAWILCLQGILTLRGVGAVVVPLAGSQKWAVLPLPALGLQSVAPALPPSPALHVQASTTLGPALPGIPLCPVALLPLHAASPLVGDPAWTHHGGLQGGGLHGGCPPSPHALPAAAGVATSGRSRWPAAANSIILPIERGRHKEKLRGLRVLL